jgi:hypothetical protein
MPQWVRSVVLGLAAGFAVATLACGSAAFGSAPAASAAPPTTPTLTILNGAFPDDAIAQGATFKLEGKGWPADTLIEIEVCGNEARSGTSDCSVDTAQVIASNANGTFQARLAVVIPPTPCPCVVRAVSQTSSDTATAAVDIPNAPSSHPGDGDVVAPALRRLEVENVALRGSDSWSTWLGGPARRTFEFEVVNTGSVAVTDATVSMTAGPADNPTGFVKPLKIDRVEVGERRAFTVPVEFDALSFGEQAVRATMNGTSVPIAFKATTTTYPWLLIIVPALIIGQLILLGIRNVLRRRLQENEQPVPVMVASIGGPADDSLICVVELSETASAASPPSVVTAEDAAVEEFAEQVVVAELGDLSESDAAADAEGDGDGRVTVRELVAAGTASDTPTVQHHTVVLRSIAAVKQLVRETLTEPADDAPVRMINAVTVLADADARVGDAHHACDDLCVWIDAAYTDAGTPFALRRRHVTASNGGMGMVPLSVLVRNASVPA